MDTNSIVFKKFLKCDIEAIIFDCDGVLVDTESIKYEAWRRALEEQGIDNYTLDYHVHHVGLESKTMLHLLSKELGRELPASIITRKREIYAEIKNTTTPMPAMVTIVKQLYACKDDLHIKIGLASGEFEKNIRHNLQVTELEDMFEVIVSGSEHLGNYTDPEGVNKPKPYIYLEAAKQLGVSPTKCIAIEDTPVGIQAAHDAGMKVIAVPNKYSENGDFSKADYVYPAGLLNFKSFIENIINLTTTFAKDEKMRDIKSSYKTWITEFFFQYQALFIKHKLSIIQFTRFCIVGVIGTCINIAITYYFTDVLGHRYLLSATLGQLVGVSFNFILNKKVTFHTKHGNIIKQYIYSLLSYSIGILTYLLLLYILVDLFGIRYLLGLVIIVPIVVTINFISHKFVVFK